MKYKILISIFCLLLCASAYGQNTRISDPIGQKTAAKSVSVVQASDSAAVRGSTNVANSQVTASTTAGTLVAARPTRRSCLIKNTDATITVYIGAATVTAANGMPLKAGESIVVSAVTLIQVKAASGSPVVAIWDEYD